MSNATLAEAWEAGSTRSKMISESSPYSKIMTRSNAIPECLI
jgi:hypothetical protein